MPADLDLEQFAPFVPKNEEREAVKNESAVEEAFEDYEDDGFDEHWIPIASAEAEVNKAKVKRKGRRRKDEPAMPPKPKDGRYKCETCGRGFDKQFNLKVGRSMYLIDM